MARHTASDFPASPLRRSLRRLLFLAFLLSLGPVVLPGTAALATGAGDLQATPWTDLHAGSRIRLVAAPGTTVLAGIELELADGWKTYWRMPGEAGVPPQFEWQGSDNVASVEVLYPAPQRLVDPAAESVGYKHAVLFPVKVRRADAKQPVTLKLEAEFGLCKDICVPIQTSLALPVAASPKPTLAPAALESALRQVPRGAGERHAGDPTVVRTLATLEGASPRLVVEARFPGGEKDADLFIEAPDSIFVPLPKAPAKAGDGALRFEIPLTAGTARDLKGKALTLTLVSAAGSSEQKWQLP